MGSHGVLAESRAGALNGTAEALSGVRTVAGFLQNAAAPGMCSRRSRPPSGEHLHHQRSASGWSPVAWNASTSIANTSGSHSKIVQSRSTPMVVSSMPSVVPLHVERGLWVDDRNPLWLQGAAGVDSTAVGRAPTLEAHPRRGRSSGGCSRSSAARSRSRRSSFTTSSRATTSDELGIVLVLYGVGIGALNAYALRPAPRAVKLDRDRLQQQIHELYRSEHEEMGERGTLERLERAREWDLAPTLAAGGVVVFPHAGVLDCGHQVAAAVHGCLDSGADRVVVDQRAPRVHRRDAGRPSARLGRRGSVVVAVLGHPGAGNRRARGVGEPTTRSSASGTSGKPRRGVAASPAPEVVERYPYLAGGHPERLPGIEELAALAEDAVIVSTADPFHHGIGYGDPPERALDPHEGGLDLARATIEEGIDLLGRGDYARLRRSLPRGEERRARCRRRLPLSAWASSAARSST